MQQTVKQHNLKTAFFYGLLFFLFTFEYSTSISYIDIGRAVENQLYNSTFHFLTQLIIPFGFFSFSLSRRIIKGVIGRRILLGINTGIYMIGLLVLVPFPDTTAALVLSFPTAFTIGYIGGTIYYYVAIGLSKHPYMGLTGAIGYGAATLLQFLLQTVLDATPVLLVLLLLGCLGLFYLIIRKPKDWMFDDPLPYAKNTTVFVKSVKRKLYYAIAIVVLFLMACCVTESTWVHTPTQIYSFPRFFLIAGFLFIGICYDLLGNRFLHVFGLCGVLFSLLGIYAADNSVLHFCAFYFAVGVYVGHAHLAFWHISVRTKHPELWASFGRIISILECLVGPIFIHIFRDSQFLTMLTVVLSLVAAIEFIVTDLLTKYDLNDTTKPKRVFLRYHSFYTLQDETTEEPIEDADADDSHQDQQAFLSFTKKYQLSPRECEVMQELLSHDEPMKVIASNLDISERMLYRYMKNLYEKTGAESRAGLVKIYYEDR